MVLGDVEQGWSLVSEDFEQSPSIDGVNYQHWLHGAKVLGVLVAKDGGVASALGICRAAEVRLFSEWRGQPDDPRWLPAVAIGLAAASVKRGNVVLVESQTDDGLPVEREPDEHKAIRAATAAGVTVVEAAGNGDREIPITAEDSGAIIVAATDSGLPHTRLSSSSFGARVDCYAPGILVTSVDDTEGGASLLGGTSAAAAIVAGMVACIQGIARRLEGAPLSPSEMRGLLRSPDYGTPVYETAGDAVPIGTMPDLEKICRLRFGWTIALESGLSCTLDRGPAVPILTVVLRNQGLADATGAWARIYWASKEDIDIRSRWKLLRSLPTPAFPGESECALSLSWATPPEGPFAVIAVLSDESPDESPISQSKIPGRKAIGIIDDA